MKRIALAIVVLTAAAYPLVTGCHIDPVQASWSGKVWPTVPQGGVSQIITCNFDSLEYVELFAGDTCLGGEYNLSVRTYPGEFPIASGAGNALRSHSWLMFDNITVTYPDSIVKGKQLEFRFSRSGADSIEPGLDVL